MSNTVSFRIKIDGSGEVKTVTADVDELGQIINSDQGCQFTSREWSETCAEHSEMKVGMDGRGRAKDNIWIERFWKTIKYEYIYIQPEENARTCSLESRDSSMNYYKDESHSLEYQLQL